MKLVDSAIGDLTTLYAQLAPQFPYLNCFL
jgi:hypothetical protein